MTQHHSIQFDPTALLIVKQEIEKSIDQVEFAMSRLMDDQTLAFGIEDTLDQFEQCAQIFSLINIDCLAKLTHYCTDLMRKIIFNSSEIQQQETLALSEGVTMLRRYMEFICLREVNVPQFLLDTFNHLEIALKLPLTQEGTLIDDNLIQDFSHLTLPSVTKQHSSSLIHKAYKSCLSNFIKQLESDRDFQTLRFIGQSLAQTSTAKPSQPYWHLCAIALNQIDRIILSDSRLRTLIQIESFIQLFLKDPQAFNPSKQDYANIVCLCISQDTASSQQIREQLKISDTLLTDDQLHIFSRHLYGPEQSTINTISQLITEELTQIKEEVSSNFKEFNEDQLTLVKAKLLRLSHIFKVLNLNEAHAEMNKQTSLFTLENIRNNPNFAQGLMNSLLACLNSIGILARNFSPNHIGIDINNLNISVDQLDQAHTILLTESKKLVDYCVQALLEFSENATAERIPDIITKLKDLLGAVIFLKIPDLTIAIQNAIEFLQSKAQNVEEIKLESIESILDIFASIDLMLENINHQQPSMPSMFQQVRLSTTNLKAVA